MPGDKIVLVPVEGLVVGSDQNGSTDKGFICFVRGKYKPKDSNEENNSKTT